MTLEEMLAREAIRESVAIYNRAVDTAGFDDLHRAFTEDAVLEIPGGTVLEGIEAIVAALRGGAGKRPTPHPDRFHRHAMAAPMITIGTDGTATGRHYILVMSELGLDHGGLYDDEYVRVGDRWLIARRTARMEWAQPQSRFVRWLGKAEPA